MEEKTESRDVYQIVTDRIVSKLEQGIVPWQQPWIESGPPQNLISHKPYRGINLMLLAMMGFERNLFLSFKQVKELGGSVKKGEKSLPVVYWKMVDQEDKETHEMVKKPFIRYYSVFNVAQCDGIPADKIHALEVREHSPIETCESILELMPNKPLIVHKNGQGAFYEPKRDFINMPERETFTSGEGYYSTLFHELVHSTGHTSRLNRKELMEMNPFASKRYSVEELTAEIGSCFLNSFAGISEPLMDNSVSYINCWLERLKNEKRFIVYASTQAQRATDFILNLSKETVEVKAKEPVNEEVA